MHIYHVHILRISLEILSPKWMSPSSKLKITNGHSTQHQVLVQTTDRAIYFHHCGNKSRSEHRGDLPSSTGSPLVAQPTEGLESVSQSLSFCSLPTSNPEIPD